MTLPFKKKTLKSDIIAIKTPVIFGLALIMGLFIIGEASAFFSDDFETYSVGSLNGQGNWFFYGTSSDVVAGTSYSGLQSILIEHFESGKRQGISLATGTLSFWFKLKDTFFDDSTPTYVDFFVGDSGGSINEGSFRIICREPITATNCATDGLALEYVKPAGGYETWATSTPFSWNNILIEWDSSLGVRYSLNSGTPTPYVIYLGSFTSLNTFYFDAIKPFGLPLNNLELYVDFIAETATSSGYIIPELGLPELPELEACDELGITDRLLCELKNFFYRLFVPSPEKITELRATLDETKTKFPYSYLLEVKDFFTYLKDNIDEEQGISFTILGNAGVVGFDFWNTTTTFAGSDQTIGDIVKVFFRFLLFLIFGLWIFSFLKRF